jgi:hypothetical protein
VIRPIKFASIATRAGTHTHPCGGRPNKTDVVVYTACRHKEGDHLHRAALCWIIHRVRQNMNKTAAGEDEGPLPRVVRKRFPDD